MMRLWLETYARPAPIGSWGGVLAGSVGVHALLIAGIVVRTAPTPEARDANKFALANRPFYIPPPNRVPQSGSREVIRYVALSPVGPGGGMGPGAMDARKPVGLAPSPRAGNVFRDSITAPAIPGTVRRDTVFTEVEVDSVAVRSDSSVAPKYPMDLLSRSITGSVLARYVVDTTGFADTSTFRAMAASHEEFVAAVRAALPFMRFSPAKLGGRKVAQLVEQEFTFRIALPKDTTDTAHTRALDHHRYETRSDSSPH